MLCSQSSSEVQHVAVVVPTLVSTSDKALSCLKVYLKEMGADDGEDPTWF